MAYQGCPVCLHAFSSGDELKQTKCVCDGYRRFLAENSRGRRRELHHRGNVYQYGTIETRPSPVYRDNELAEKACAFAARIGSSFLGHKRVPLTAAWPGFDLHRYCPGEMMHDVKVACDMFMKVLVGKGKQGTSYANWSKDNKHREQAKILDIFEGIWPENAAPLPWRLTKVEVKELDDRMKCIVWPHYMERLYYKGESCWIAPNRMWKARRKYRLLIYMLVTQLRDMVPAVHQGLLYFVWALRRLDGQVHSYEVAKNLNILPGARTVQKSLLRGAHRDIIRGLTLLEGSLPVSHLNPALHHFVHYAQYTATHGPLRKLWMMAFER